MIVKYTCATCGYDSAVWHLRLDESRLELCENCVRNFSKPDSHISGFTLNKRETRRVIRR